MVKYYTGKGPLQLLTDFSLLFLLEKSVNRVGIF